MPKNQFLDMNETKLGVLSFVSFIFTFNTILYFRKVKRPLVVCGSKESEVKIENCKTLNSCYFPFYFAWGKNSQLILAGIYFQYQKYMKVIKWKKESFIMEDGQEIIVDWAVSTHPNAESGFMTSQKNTPILIIHHGLMCSSNNLPGQGWVTEAHKRGWIVCCQHRRGTKASLSIPKINIFGSTADTKFFIENYLLKRRPNAKILLIGISAGSGLVARFLGEEGDSKLITAAMGLCPGYDISICMKRLEPIFGNYLVRNIKQFYLKRNWEHFYTFEGYDKCLNSSDCQEYLDNSYVMAGYKSTTDYYKHCNPVEVMEKIRTPFLVINSEDDPICIYENALENLHVFKNSPSAIFVGTKTGTHCAFWEGFSMNSWAERATYEFFETCLVE